MSFVVLLVLSLATLVSIETSNADRAKKQLLAKENARLGVMVAIGSIQKEAGPDEIVTVRADAFEAGGATIENPYWVGVVDAEAPTSDPNAITWLVSSDPSNPERPSNVMNENNSEVVTPSSLQANLAVRAPLLDIETDENQYGFWVSDESLKASIATRPVLDEQEETWLDGAFLAAEAERLEQIVPKRAGIEMLFTTLNTDDEVASGQLNRLAAVDELPLADAWDFSAYQDFFHDISDRSFGVLASTTGTGLKKDLSLNPGRMDDLIPGSFEELYDFIEYMEEPLPELQATTPWIPFEEDLRRRYKIQAPSTDVAGEISDGIYPVLTSFRILFGIHVAGGDVTGKTSGSFSPITNPDELVVRVQLHAELWNPYTSALVPENLVLRVDNLPTVTVQLEESGGTLLGPYSINLNRVLGNGGRGRGALSGYFVELPFTDRGFPNNHDDFSWLPGRVYNWTGQNNFSGGSSKADDEGLFYSRSLSSSIFYEGTGTVPPREAPTLRISGPQTDIAVSLRTKASASASVTSGEELFLIEDISFDGFDTGFSIPSDSRSIRFGYQIQRDESGFVALSQDPWEKSRWLRVEDPRELRPSFDDSGQGTGAFQAPNGLDPTAYTSSAISQPDFLFDRTAGGSGLRPSEDVPLFELFRQRPISIGELQHLKIIDNRPFAIGNSWGEDPSQRFNRLFDEAFFSGLAQGDTTPNVAQGEALPNHRLRTVAEITGSSRPTLTDLLAAQENSSEQLIVEGSFNVNSTSADAWAAMLGSIFIREWDVANINTFGDLDVRAPRVSVDAGQTILRFPQSAQEVFNTAGGRDSFQPPTEYFRVGAKFFRTSTSGGDSDPEPYRDLGEAIAERVAQRIQILGPFVSVEEFLAPVEEAGFSDPNDGSSFLSVVERAILDVAELNQEAGQDIWHHTSSFLSQADVMTGLAPVAATRGDTFVVRAVGKTDSPAGNDPVTAVCEARIQRIPDVVDPSDSVLIPDPQGLGRKFVISSIRWINQ